jgi:hypothetical protein
MAASTAGISLPPVATSAQSVSSIERHRAISPEAGRALEILAHAIEYLTDEYAEHATTLSHDAPELQAIQLLMSINRQVYFDCPLVPTFADRMRALFHSPAA